MEISIKIVAFGLIFGHESCFLRNKMNALDSVVILLSVINLILDIAGIEPPLQFGVLRSLRVLRGLKISRNLQDGVDCLLATLVKIFNYFLLYMLLLFIYGVIGKYIIIILQ